MDYIEIGKRIRKYRKIRNLSQEQLAEKVNISVTHMSHIETGSTKLSLIVLTNIAEKLKVSCDDILFGSNRQLNQNSFIKFDDSYTSDEILLIGEIIKSLKSNLHYFEIKKKK